jgi:REP element-mobilizing transposase RayT
MAIKLTQSEAGTYFCTFTCLNWIPLFEKVNLYDEIYKWLNILISNQHQITGFVIMPDHLHALIHLGHNKDSINKILPNGKRFMAYEIVSRLEETGQRDILTILERHVTLQEKKRNKKHRVFEVSSDIKFCYTQKFLLQKLNYIHHNPVTEKAQFVKTPEEYYHSSAAFYETGVQHPQVCITHYNELTYSVSSPPGDDT